MKRRELLLLSLAGLLSACGTPAPRPAPRHPEPVSNLAYPAQGADIAFRALGLVGTPYRRAGADPAQGFDCSGFVQYVFRDSAGIALPRSTGEQYALPSSRGMRKLRTGDLVFFATGGRGPSHVGIYVGEGRFVHAPNHGGKVRLDRMDDAYWRPRYLGARRVLR